MAGNKAKPRGVHASDQMVLLSYFRTFLAKTRTLWPSAGCVPLAVYPGLLDLAMYLVNNTKWYWYVFVYCVPATGLRLRVAADLGLLRNTSPCFY